MTIWTCGEAMTALRCDGPLRLGTSWTTHVAGAELNAAVGLSRLGHQVTWCSQLGRDDFGRLVLREVLAEAITVDAALIDGFTGTMQVVKQAGTSSVSYHRRGSAASMLDAATLVHSLERARPEWVLLSGITPALSQSCLEGWQAAAAHADDLGCTVVLDINHRPSLWTDQQARQAITPVLGHADLIVGDAAELALVCTATDEPAMVAELLASGASRVAIKRGAAGASLFSASGAVHQQAEPATEIDPIGAGDAFTAGLISALIDGLDDTQALARAVAMGAWAVCTPGDWEGLPTRAQLEAGRGGVRR